VKNPMEEKPLSATSDEERNVKEKRETTKGNLGKGRGGSGRRTGHTREERGR